MKPVEYDTYPQPVPKPKFKIKIDWDDVGYWFATWGVGIALIAGAIWGITAIVQFNQRYDEWSLNCVSNGNMVVSRSGPDFCVSEARVLSTNPKAENTAEYFAGCLAAGGYLGTIYNSGYLCVAGKVISQY